MKLYVYDHCPYCVRVRMIIGLKKCDVEIKVLQSNDEETPVSMVGKKMVPILEKTDGSFMPESLDIVHYLDQLSAPAILTSKPCAELEGAVSQLTAIPYLKLTMPRFVIADLPEFSTEPARQYFFTNKQKVVGKFSDNMNDTASLIAQIMPVLNKIDQLIANKDANNDEISINDILLFPLLRNLTIVKALTLPKNVLAYTKAMSERCQVPLYLDIAI